MVSGKTLARMGLGPVWRLRASAAEDVADVPVEAPRAQDLPAPLGDVLARVDFARDKTPVQIVQSPVMGGSAPEWTWDELGEIVAGCRKCRLCERRKQAVLGVGDRDADWMFVGEGPGAEEDERGEPFVGQAGRLLDAMLAAIGLARGRGVYIANTVKCRPPNNRTPEAEETAACFPYLERQIALVRPRLIVALGRPAAQILLDQEVRIAGARGRAYRFGGIPVTVTYHPAYLLRNPADKRKSWEDLCFARDLMEKQGED